MNAVRKNRGRTVLGAGNYPQSTCLRLSNRGMNFHTRAGVFNAPNVEPAAACDFNAPSQAHVSLLLTVTITCGAGLGEAKSQGWLNASQRWLDLYLGGELS